MSLSSCILPRRSILKVEGEERLEFLQGLVSNDVTKATEEKAVYSAFLTPQGKFLCDFFLIQKGDSLLLDLEESAFAAFKKKLTMFKLRADVKLSDVTADYDVVAVFGGETSQPGIFEDPRLAEAGYRAIVEKGTRIENAEDVDFDVYDLHRIKLGLPDGSRDMTVEKSILLENGFDELNGVDWDKGCYMGQELTARTKYRALIKKRLLPISVNGELPPSGTEIKSGDKVVGEVRSGVHNHALATIKLDAMNQSLTVDGENLKVNIPKWIDLPEV